MELVIFDIQQNRFAFRASAIRQVLSPLAVTPLPFSLPEVEGLVNVTGAVLLKIDLAFRLGMRARCADVEGNLIVVFTGHEHIALQVDQVHNKINLNESLLTPCVDPSQAHLISGEFTLDERLVLLLDEHSLDLREMNPEGVPEGGGGLIGFDFNDDSRTTSAKPSSLEMATITVQESGETYALELSHVQEIVEIGQLTQLPGASIEVAGLMPLRGKVLFILSLGALLNHPNTTPANFVLVVQVQGIQLGLSVSSIIGIERYARETIQAVVGPQDAQLQGYLNGAAARHGHITSLLSVTGLLSPQAIGHYQRFLTLKTKSMHDNEQVPPCKVRRMLSFRLGSERCALSLSVVDQVEEYNASVNLPEGDKYLIGVTQIKGEIAPVMDLRVMLGVQPLETTGYVVVRIDSEPWALIVDRIERVIDIQETDITPVRNQHNDYLNEVGKLDGELISLITLTPLTQAAKRLLK